MQGVARGLGRLSAGLDRLALAGAAIAVIVMVAAAVWQVIARYLLSAPPIWTEELASHSMVWAGMLGASAAFRASADPTLFPGARAIGGGRGLLLSAVRAAGVLLLAVPVLYYSFFSARGDITRGFLARSAARDAEMIDLSMVWFTVAIPVAFSLIVIHLLAELAARAAGIDPVAATEPTT
ncbi:MAG: TRAP transporter small permease subunit [Pseudomonadota bacterium]